MYLRRRLELWVERGGSRGRKRGCPRLSETEKPPLSLPRDAGRFPEAVRGERCALGNGSSDKPGAVMEHGEHSWQGNRSAGCSTWLFNFDLVSLRLFFHLMLCKNWFYLPLIFFFVCLFRFVSPLPFSSCG